VSTVLVTGTGIRVGKTRVACGLAGALGAAGRRVVAVKAVETGRGDATAVEDDGAVLAAATGQAEPREPLVRLTAPVVPALAAEREDTTIDLDALVLRIEELRTGTDVLLLEGAGGLLSPIAWEWSVVELAQTLGAAVLVVGIDAVGVINHALLTLSSLELAGLPVLGVVLTPPDAADASTGTNAAAIARVSGLDRVVALSGLPDGDAASLAPVLRWMEQQPEEWSA
jgi:dethiobiotin synthetase